MLCDGASPAPGRTSYIVPIWSVYLVPICSVPERATWFVARTASGRVLGKVSWTSLISSGVEKP